MRIRTAYDLGRLIRSHRKSQGLSQRALAEKVGTTQSWVWAIEQGKPSAEVGLLLRTLDVLAVEVNILAPWDVEHEETKQISNYPDLGNLLDGPESRER
ncbi:MAG: helix-turn-helix domain-containing protein [Aquisalimonadaceae bacterium]